MTVPSHVSEMLRKIRARFGAEPIEQRMLPSDAEFTTLRPVRNATEASVQKYWSRLLDKTTKSDQAALADPQSVADVEKYSANIENFIGTVKVPVGIIGPLRINGLNANGDFHVPMATTEAALVASYARGAYAVTRSGGVSTAMLYEGVIRTPACSREERVAVKAALTVGSRSEQWKDGATRWMSDGERDVVGSGVLLCVVCVLC